MENKIFYTQSLSFLVRRFVVDRWRMSCNIENLYLRHQIQVYFRFLFCRWTLFHFKICSDFDDRFYRLNFWSIANTWLRKCSIFFAGFQPRSYQVLTLIDQGLCGWFISLFFICVYLAFICTLGTTFQICWFSSLALLFLVGRGWRRTGVIQVCRCPCMPLRSRRFTGFGLHTHPCNRWCFSRFCRRRAWRQSK